MKKIAYFLFAFAALLSSCDNQPKGLEVTVSNPSDFDRSTDMVEVLVDEIGPRVTLSEGQVYEVKNSKGEVIPSQVTSDGRLIFQSGVKANESAIFTVVAGAKQDFKAQTYGRYISERKDDFAWENDRVAFRAYGPALVEIDGPSNGFDLWYKRTPDMVIDKWYKGDLAGTASYHADHGEGLDDYKVGRSLGGGAMAPYAGNKLWLNENYASQEVLDNGPLRTTFRLTYKDVNVDGKTFSESRTVTIDAGSQLSKVTQEYGTADAMPVAAGIVKRAQGDSIIVSSDKSYLVYLEPKSANVEGIYIGLVFPQGMESTTVDTYTVKNDKTKKDDSFSHVLAITTYKPGTPVTYYTGYGWNKYGFANEGEFEKYLQNFVKGLKEPFNITLK